METQSKFSLLRRILKTIGLSAEAVDDIVERIEDFLSDKEPKTPGKPDYPYNQREHFLSPAEYSFFMVLKSVVADSALISIKVGLSDLFYARSSDANQYRLPYSRLAMDRAGRPRGQAPRPS